MRPIYKNLDIVLLFGNMALYFYFFLIRDGWGIWTKLLSNFKHRLSTCLAYHVLHSSTPPLNKIIPWFCIPFHYPQGLVYNYCNLTCCLEMLRSAVFKDKTSLKFLNGGKRSFLWEILQVATRQDHVSKGIPNKDRPAFFSISNATLLCFLSPLSCGGKKKK